MADMIESVPRRHRSDQLAELQLHQGLDYKF